jgi:hypothetical protein
LLLRQFADVTDELRVFAPEKVKKGSTKILSVAPLPHIVLPRTPPPRLLRRHGSFVEKEISALEEGDSISKTMNFRSRCSALRSGVGSLEKRCRSGFSRATFRKS